MDIVCPQCNAAYRFPESRIPSRGASFSCKRCGKRLRIQPPARPLEKQARETLPMGPPPVQAPVEKGQNKAIVQEFPEAADFMPRNYVLDQLLQTDKKGRYKTRLNKLKLKLLVAVKAPLDQLLEQDEQVLHIAGATAYYPFEIIFGNGWLTTLYNRYIVVATNRRLVAVNTNYKMTKPAHYLFQFPYETIKKISRGLFGTSLSLKRKTKKRRTFTSIKRALAGEMKNFISTRIDPSRSPDEKASARENLCPACFKALPAQLTACPGCHAQFKTPRKAALRSLLLPGWGDIYLGQRFLGGLELMGSFMSWIFAISSLLSNSPEGLIMAIAILLFYNGLDSLVTLHMAKKGYLLEKKQPQTAVMGRLSAHQA